jgi:hypothetical protein
MKQRYVIERDLPGIGGTPSEDLKDAAGTSNRALAQLGEQIQWEHSYVAGDKNFCLYLADNEDVIHEHARLSGFPATVVTPVVRMIDPTTEAAG